MKSVLISNYKGRKHVVEISNVIRLSEAKNYLFEWLGLWRENVVRARRRERKEEWGGRKENKKERGQVEREKP